MLKLLMVMTFIFSTSAFSADEALSPSPSAFEAELRALETDSLSLKTEELQMRNADAVTDVVSDEVGTRQAATLRSKDPALKQDNSDIDVIPAKEKKPSQIERERRVRSR
jgi:hypothetical protein